MLSLSLGKRSLKVKLIAPGKVVISGFIDRGVKITIIDENIKSMGAQASTIFRKEDGSFKAKVSAKN